MFTSTPWVLFPHATLSVVVITSLVIESPFFFCSFLPSLTLCVLDLRGLTLSVGQLFCLTRWTVKVHLPRPYTLRCFSVSLHGSFIVRSVWRPSSSGKPDFVLSSLKSGIFVRPPVRTHPSQTSVFLSVRAGMSLTSRLRSVLRRCSPTDALARFW